jgi:acyl dehydratase
MSIEYFEDIKLHQKSRSKEYPLTEKEIIDYASVWDPRPYHINPEFARSTKFGGLLASGSHLVAICHRLANEKSINEAYIAGMGWEKVEFLYPAKPGDTLTLEEEVLWKRESKSDPNVGIIHHVARLLNQRGEAVFAMEVTGLVKKRPATGTPSSESGKH